MSHPISPPPLKSAMGTQRWIDWFAKLDDFLDASPKIIAKAAFTTETAYISPTLEDKYVYEVYGTLTPSSSSATIALNFHNSGGIVNSASSYGYSQQADGVGAAAADRNGIFLTLGNTTGHRHPFHLQIFNARNSSIKSETLINTAYNSSGIKSMVATQYRVVTEDNTKFQITAISGITGTWTTSGTFTGNIVIRRHPLEEV